MLTKRDFLAIARRAMMAIGLVAGVGKAAGQSGGAPASGLTLTATEQKSISTRIHELVWGGFDPRAELLETAHDYENPRTWTADDDAWVTDEVDRQLAGKFAAEATWPKVTDWDRLDAAFKQIEARKILALHNAGNTQSDAMSDASEIWHGRGAKNSDLRGYIFYHGQDVDSVVATGQLHIGYGAFDDDKKTSHQMAVEVCGILTAAGFNVVVPPNAGTRIRVDLGCIQRLCAGLAQREIKRLSLLGSTGHLRCVPNSDLAVRIDCAQKVIRRGQQVSHLHLDCACLACS